MSAEEEFLRWAEQALQIGQCEAAMTCGGAGMGVWYVSTLCSHGHVGRTFTCCSGCGHHMVGRAELSCVECGGRKEGTVRLLILAKVMGEGLKITTFEAGLKDVQDSEL